MQLHPLRAHWPESHQSCWRRASGSHTSPAHSSCCWSPPLREERENRFRGGSCVIIRVPIWFWDRKPGRNRKDISCSSCSVKSTELFTLSHESLLFHVNSVQFKNTLSIPPKGISSWLRMRILDDIVMDLPVKSTFPYRSWIWGARPSLNKYRLENKSMKFKYRIKRQQTINLFNTWEPTSWKVLFKDAVMEILSGVKGGLCFRNNVTPEPLQGSIWITTT